MRWSYVLRANLISLYIGKRGASTASLSSGRIVLSILVISPIEVER